MKPVATGTRPVTAPELPIFAGFCAVGDMINDDVVAIAALSPPDCERLDINPYCFDWGVSPHIAAARAGVRIEPERVAAAYERLAARCDAVVVEGTGGWFAPIGECGTMADIAQRLALPVVLTVGLRLGCLNHALLTAQAIGRIEPASSPAGSAAYSSRTCRRWMRMSPRSTRCSVCQDWRCCHTRSPPMTTPMHMVVAAAALFDRSSTRAEAASTHLSA